MILPNLFLKVSKKAANINAVFSLSFLFSPLPCYLFIPRYNKSLMLPTFLPICHLCPPCSIRPAETNILCLLLNRTNYRMRTDWRIFFEIKP